MPRSTPQVRSWIWGGVALILGLAVYICDDWVESLRVSSLPRTVVNYIEVMVMGPGMAVMAFALSEQLRLRDERHRNHLERERQKRFQFLGRIAASMAHEVRNPLHNLVLLSNELSTQVAEPQRELCMRIRSNLERLDNATQLIYELAKPQGQQQVEEIGSIPLPRLVQQICMELQAQAELPADLQIEPASGEMLVAGRMEGLRIVVQNLVRNAIEAAAGGPVRLTYFTEGDEVRLQIRNHGALAVEFQEEEPDTISHKPGGLGVGLAIARHLTALYGGGIRLASDADWVVATLTLRTARG